MKFGQPRGLQLILGSARCLLRSILPMFLHVHLRKYATKSGIDEAVTMFSCFQGLVAYPNREEVALARIVTSKKSP